MITEEEIPGYQVRERFRKDGEVRALKRVAELLKTARDRHPMVENYVGCQCAAWSEAIEIIESEIVG